jgi:glycine cleavage system aminomethyltransferase T
MTLTTISGTPSQEQAGPGPVGDYGDVRREFRALLEGCGVYEAGSRTRIRLTGGDRFRWLNGMVTNNIRDLQVNHGVYAFLLNAQGHIQADLNAYNLGAALLVDADGGLPTSTSTSSPMTWK